MFHIQEKKEEEEAINISFIFEFIFSSSSPSLGSTLHPTNGDLLSIHALAFGDSLQVMEMKKRFLQVDEEEEEFVIYFQFGIILCCSALMGMKTFVVLFLFNS